MSHPAIQITGLSKTYASGTHALKSVDLTVKQGDFFGLLGANGAGKTTLIGILTGIVKKTGGKAEIFGIDLDQNHDEAKRLVGVVPQEFNFNIFEKVIDIVAQQGGYFGIPRKQALALAEPILKVLNLWEKRHSTAMSLSGGMKRRLMIARALIHEPKLLILDEPTAGVDVELRHGMWEYLEKINKAGTTILLTTHYLEEAQALCNRLAIIKTGELVRQGSARDLIQGLDRRHYVLQLQGSIPEKLTLADYPCRFTVEGELEVELKNGQSLNPLMAQLAGQGIEVLDISPKGNPLEQLFLNILKP